MGGKRKHCGDEEEEEEEESLFLNIAPDMFRLIVSFLDDKSLYAVSAANRQTYEEAQPVFQTRFLRDCPAWPLSELAKRIEIGGISPTDRSWAAFYKIAKSKLSFVGGSCPIDINPNNETEMLFDIAVATADNVYSVISSGTVFMNRGCNFRIEMPQFDVDAPLRKEEKGWVIHIGLRVYIINQNLHIIKVLHEETCIVKYTSGDVILFCRCNGVFSFIHAPSSLFFCDGKNDVVRCSSNGEFVFFVKGVDYLVNRNPT